MTEINLATIFGPTILFKESPTSRGYRDPTQTPTTSLAETNYSLTIAADLLNHFCFLFDVSQEVGRHFVTLLALMVIFTGHINM